MQTGKQVNRINGFGKNNKGPIHEERIDFFKQRSHLWSCVSWTLDLEAAVFFLFCLCTILQGLLVHGLLVGGWETHSFIFPTLMMRTEDRNYLGRTGPQSSSWRMSLLEVWTARRQFCFLILLNEHLPRTYTRGCVWDWEKAFRFLWICYRGDVWGGGFEVTSCYYGSQGPFLVALIKELKS